MRKCGGAQRKWDVRKEGGVSQDFHAPHFMYERRHKGLTHPRDHLCLRSDEDIYDYFSPKVQDGISYEVKSGGWIENGFVVTPGRIINT